MNELKEKRERHQSYMLLGDAANPPLAALQELRRMAYMRKMVIIDSPCAGSSEGSLAQIYSGSVRQIQEKTVRDRELLGTLQQVESSDIVLLRSRSTYDLSRNNPDTLAIKIQLARIAQEGWVVAEGTAGAVLGDGTKAHNQLSAKLRLGASKHIPGVQILPFAYAAPGCQDDLDTLKTKIEQEIPNHRSPVIISPRSNAVAVQLNGEVRVQNLGDPFLIIRTRYGRTTCQKMCLTTIEGTGH